MIIVNEHIVNKKKRKKLFLLLERKKSLELLYFIEDFNDMKKESNQESQKEKILDMYCRYIADGAVHQINLSGEQHCEINKNVLNTNPSSMIFDDVHISVVGMLSDHIVDAIPEKNFFNQLKKKINSHSSKSTMYTSGHKTFEFSKSSFF